MSGAAGGMTARSEFEWPVAGARLDPLRFATTPFRRKLGKAERRGLVPQFTTDIVRTTIPLAFADSTMASLCIDTGEVRAEVDGKRLHAPINEIELELEAGDPTRLFELARTRSRPSSRWRWSPSPRRHAATRCATRWCRSGACRGSRPRPARKCRRGFRRNHSRLPETGRRQRGRRADADGPGVVAPDAHRIRRLRASLALGARYMAPARSNRCVANFAGWRKLWASRAIATYSRWKHCRHSAPPSGEAPMQPL